jgi:ribonuclease P protein component
LKYTKSHRLLTAKDFRYVFEKPKKIKAGAVDFYIRANALQLARLGLAVPKKAVKRAVDRNRFKRLLREQFRKHQQQLAGYDIVVVVRGTNAHGLAKQWQKVCDSCV